MSNKKELEALEDRIKACENKLNKMANLEERLEKCFQNVEKYRNRMIQNGYSYEMLEEFNKAIQPITQHYNEIRKARKKIADAENAIREVRQREEDALKKRQRQLIEHVVLTAAVPEFPYNVKCREFSFTDGEAICGIKMDLQYCNNNCPYATNQVCSNKVNGKGMTVVYNKRRIR